MNWLAHVFLSEHNSEFQIGNFLADPLKGKAWASASDDLIKGMKTHILIDVYTDSHQIVSRSKARLREKGLLKSVVIDVVYDYFLSKNWDKYVGLSKVDFLLEFSHNARADILNYPDKPKTLVKNLIEGNRLDKYNTLDQLKNAFERIDSRLSPKLLARESTCSYFEKVCKIESELESDFLMFFPELCEYVKSNVDSKKLTHWR
ncbi:ACP phosphodiesterase [Lentisphaera profundi]|uniref:ACP phosphodiesterase n=1 Tax=Lentisphaera profundi TaxID=1658616 RepID=A0ABY7VX06_9BACT|nr:ACP phosphodiesterase [Lentisphaera profundi]WDE98627.1 ACP phosphodiesterase [Lentisphaera profundi]